MRGRALSVMLIAPLTAVGCWTRWRGVRGARTPNAPTRYVHQLSGGMQQRVVTSARKRSQAESRASEQLSALSEDNSTLARVVVTFALAGFATSSSIAIQIGAIAGLVAG